MKAPNDKKIEIIVVEVPDFHYEGCTSAGVEIKTHPDQRLTGYRFCSTTFLNTTLISKSNLVPVITYARDFGDDEEGSEEELEEGEQDELESDDESEEEDEGEEESRKESEEGDDSGDSGYDNEGGGNGEDEDDSESKRDEDEDYDEEYFAYTTKLLYRYV